VFWLCSRARERGRSRVGGMATTVPESQPPGADDSLESELETLGQNFYVEMNGIVRGSRVQVPVTTELIGVNLQLVLDAQVFKDWVEAVDKDDILFINGVEVQSIDMFGPRVGFIKFKADAVINIGGEEGAVMVPGIVFMRGGAVGILVILECDGREYTILTYQARVPVGCHNLPEVPAGMLDGSGNFKGVAADEIAEVRPRKLLWAWILGKVCRGRADADNVAVACGTGVRYHDL
jgi:hypothetical protein